MNIEYKTGKYFRTEDLRDLFLSVNWGSGKYPDRLPEAMKHSETVISAWDGRKLVGLITVISDGCMNAYIPYVLVHPQWQGKGIGAAMMKMVKKAYSDYLTLTVVALDSAVPFYEKCGFIHYQSTSPLHISKLPD